MTSVSSLFISAGSSQKAEYEKPVVNIFTSVPEFTPKIEILGEKIDLTRFDMYERYDRELTSFCYTHNLTLTLLKRANRYFPIIEPILKEEGIPADFIYLMAIESSLNPFAVSPAKAAGLWQIMETTGRELGLEVNANVDERYHVEKSTKAACKYLKNAYNIYGNWLAAAASYNAGRARITSELNKQGVDDVYDLWLNEETSRYTFRIMAIKEIMSRPYKYGFVLKSNQLYKPIKTKDVIVKGEIKDLAVFAKENGVTYSQLKQINQWLKGRSLINKTGKTYIIKIPLTEDMYYESGKYEIHNKNWVTDIQ